MATLFIVYIPNSESDRTSSKDSDDEGEGRSKHSSRPSSRRSSVSSNRRSSVSSNKCDKDSSSDEENESHKTSEEKGVDHNENSSASCGANVPIEKEKSVSLEDEATSLSEEIPQQNSEIKDSQKEENPGNISKNSNGSVGLPVSPRREPIDDEDAPLLNNTATIRKSSKPEIGSAKPEIEGPTKEEEEQEMVTEHISFEQLLQAILENLKIEGDIWTVTDDEESIQVSFIVDKRMADLVLQYLSKHGIGKMENTSVSLFPADYHMTGQERKETEKAKPKSDWDQTVDTFMKSVKSRLTVAQVVEAVKANTILTFDFLLFLILAGIIAGMGLVENSSVVLVASMLVSPLMGPIMGGTFGVVIRNGELWRLGLKNESIGLFLCILIGFLMGLVISGVNIDGADWGSSDSWPTAEMRSRGLLRSLWVGVLIALPSGAGVALSILGGNHGSLVGVAISASLLPPAVNAGMLWACALLSSIYKPEIIEETRERSEFFTSFNSNGTNTSTVINPTAERSSDSTVYPPDCPKMVNNNYEFVYRCDLGQEAAILGTVSLTLTLINILCIIIMAILILKLKEVAPTTALSTYLDNFWKTDIKVARDTYKTMKMSNSMSTNLAKHAKHLAQVAKEKQIADETEIYDSLVNDPVYLTVAGHLPKTGNPLHLQQGLAMNYYPMHTIHNVPSWTPKGTQSLTSPSVLNPFQFQHEGRRKGVERSLSDGQPTKPLQVLKADNSHFHRARRLSYRHSSINIGPASLVTVLPSKMNKSKGRFMITVIEESSGASSTTPNSGATTAKNSPAKKLQMDARTERVTFSLHNETGATSSKL